ncbi:MAG TPA: hypothetical protein VFT22_41240 [Kofleriaceae bacterium]|nr:hypothetical protein [Kofleriaceae bacterium]
MTVPLRYKFVELSVVTEKTIEDSVNEWVGQGWQLEGIRFVTTEHSKRPAMAFVSFIRHSPGERGDRDEPDDDERPGNAQVIAATDNDVE